MGERGPAPRREAEVRRTNNKGRAVTFDRAALQDLPFEVDLEPDPLPAANHWNEFIKDLWDSLKRDPARKWMTSADWSSTRLVLEVAHTAMDSEDGMNGATLATFLKHLNAIGVTEAARMRLQKEITLFPRSAPEAVASVTDIDTARRDEVQ